MRVGQPLPWDLGEELNVGKGREPAGCVPGFLVLKPEGRCSHVVTRWSWEEGKVESVRPECGRDPRTM